MSRRSQGISGTRSGHYISSLSRCSFREEVFVSVLQRKYLEVSLPWTLSMLISGSQKCSLDSNTLIFHIHPEGCIIEYEIMRTVHIHPTYLHCHLRIHTNRLHNGTAVCVSFLIAKTIHVWVTAVCKHVCPKSVYVSGLLCDQVPPITGNTNGSVILYLWYRDSLV